MPYICILRIGQLINPIGYTMTEQETLITRQLFLYLDSPVIQQWLAVILIFIQALLVNYITNRHKLSHESTLFSGALYVIYVTLFVTNSALTPALIANTFIILAVESLLQTYKATDDVAHVFNTAFFLSLAALIYPPYIFGFIFGYMSLAFLYTMRFRAILQYLIGYLVPPFLLFTVSLFAEGLKPFSELYLHYLVTLPKFNPLGLNDIIPLAAFGITLIFVILSLSSITLKKTIQAQKKIEVFYLLLVFLGLGFFSVNSESFELQIGLAIPVSVLVGIFISDSKSKLTHELYHILLVAIIFITYFKIFNV